MANMATLTRLYRNSSSLTAILLVTVLTSSLISSTCYAARNPGAAARLLQGSSININSISSDAKFQIPTSDGDTFQCVTTSLQPSLENNPLLLKHAIQWLPNYLPQANLNSINTQEIGDSGSEEVYNNQTANTFNILQVPKVEEITVDPQEWVINTVCPTGTIPLRDNKPPPSTTTNYNYNQNADSDPNAAQVVGMYTDPAGSSNLYYGAAASINFWQPQVETPSELSRSSMRLYLDEAKKYYIETGWEVFPRRYGDNNAKWFVDSSMGSFMDGFVQVSNRVMLGGTISPLSRTGATGVLYGWESSIYLDPQSKNWWLLLQGVPLGYWPAELFPNVQGVVQVEWIATVVDSRPNGAHTTTQMGNGNFPVMGAGFGYPASYRGLKVMDNIGGNYVPAANLKQGVDNPNCYNILATTDTSNGLINFYYGGPGKGPQCP